MGKAKVEKTLRLVTTVEVQNCLSEDTLLAEFQKLDKEGLEQLQLLRDSLLGALSINKNFTLLSASGIVFYQNMEFNFKLFEECCLKISGFEEEIEIPIKAGFTSTIQCQRANGSYTAYLVSD